ncbi:hypothetical protein BSG1_10248 [Bacillus sp. SG-1]|nr:hypothetical protein BSG1_10248 [Bacillus sp. SG-1]
MAKWSYEASGPMNRSRVTINPKEAAIKMTAASFSI